MRPFREMNSVPVDDIDQGRGVKDYEMRKKYRQYDADVQLLLGGSGFGVEIDPNLPASMAFDHVRRMILLNPERIEEMGLSPDQERYIFSHEIAHFVQLLGDPRTYERTFDLAKEKGGKVGEEYAEQAKKLWGRFYNVFLDISDNAIVDSRSLWAQKKRGGDHTGHSIYRDKLTQEDMSGKPKTEQFLFGLLRRAMLGYETPLTLDPDVEVVLDAPYTYLGRKYKNFYEFVEKKFFDADLPLNVLVSVLERSAVPLFEKFLEQDIESGEVNKANKPTDMLGEDMDPDEMKDLIKKVKASRAPGSEKAAAKARGRFEKEMGGKGFSEQEIGRMLEIKERANEVYRSMVDLWEVFVQTTFTRKIVEETAHRSGHAPDVEQFIRQFPDFVSQPDQLRLFFRRFLSPEVEGQKPKLIELFLLPDLSGSMDTNKRQAVQESAYALAKSLVQFKRDQAMRTGDGDSPDINLRFLGFGSSTVDLFDRSAEELADGVLNDEQPDELDARLWRSILRMGTVGLGGTEDNKALQAVLDEVSRHDRAEKYADGDRVSIVIEVTDGETSTVAASQRIVYELLQKSGVFPRAIQIPGGMQPDFPQRGERDGGGEKMVDIRTFEPSRAFEEVWGEKGLKLGNIQQLRAVMLHFLFDALREKAS